LTKIFCVTWFLVTGIKDNASTVETIPTTFTGMKSAECLTFSGEVVKTLVRQETDTNTGL
jgi:hypothetical protein